MLYSILKDRSSLLGSDSKRLYRHSCGSADVRHSHQKGWFIDVAKRLGYEAFRCRACGKRFFKKLG